MQWYVSMSLYLMCVNWLYMDDCSWVIALWFCWWQFVGVTLSLEFGRYTFCIYVNSTKAIWIYRVAHVSGIVTSKLLVGFAKMSGGILWDLAYTGFWYTDEVKDLNTTFIEIQKWNSSNMFQAKCTLKKKKRYMISSIVCSCEFI